MASIPVGVDVAAWRQRIRNRVQNPPAGSEPLELNNFTQELQVLRETAPQDVNVDTLSVHAVIPLITEIVNILTPVGTGGRRYRKSRRRRHGRKKTHRRS
jgi:hypothetical protein